MSDQPSIPETGIDGTTTNPPTPRLFVQHALAILDVISFVDDHVHGLQDLSPVENRPGEVEIENLLRDLDAAREKLLGYVRDLSTWPDHDDATYHRRAQDCEWVKGTELHQDLAVVVGIARRSWQRLDEHETREAA